MVQDSEEEMREGAGGGWRMCSEVTGSLQLRRERSLSFPINIYWRSLLYFGSTYFSSVRRSSFPQLLNAYVFGWGGGYFPALERSCCSSAAPIHQMGGCFIVSKWPPWIDYDVFSRDVFTISPNRDSFLKFLSRETKVPPVQRMADHRLHFISYQIILGRWELYPCYSTSFCPSAYIHCSHDIPGQAQPPQDRTCCKHDWRSSILKSGQLRAKEMGIYGPSESAEEGSGLMFEVKVWMRCGLSRNGNIIWSFQDEPVGGKAVEADFKLHLWL